MESAVQIMAPVCKLKQVSKSESDTVSGSVRTCIQKVQL